MALPALRRQPRRALALGVLLCVILLPLAQAGLGALSSHASSPWYWLVGTPLSYLMIGGLGAFCVTGGLAPPQACARGSLVGLLAGSGGAAVATLIMLVAIVVALSHPMAQGTMPRLALITTMVAPISPGMVIVFFAPFFLAVNLLGIGLASLGGMLGGMLRAGLTWHGSRVDGQSGGASIIAIATTVIVLAVLLAVGGIMFLTGAFSSTGVTPAH